VRYRPRLLLVQAVMLLLPWGVGNNVRTALYRAAGFRRIHHTVNIAGRLRFRGEGAIVERFAVGPGSSLNAPAFFELGAPVEIGRGSGIGHHLLVATTTHDDGDPLHRAGRLVCRPVRIGDGVWVAARVTITPGVSVGDGAVVCAGAVVTKDVPANAKVAGNPARVIGWVGPRPEHAS
ncbi:MAG: acyltransferase, partial [Candidatus Dormibacteraceae bacterium]